MAAPAKLISTSQGFQDGKGNLASLGFLSLQLEFPSEVIATGGQVTTQAILLPLDSNAKITTQAIWFSDELSGNPRYRAILYGSNGSTIIQDFGYWSIIGASADLSTMVAASSGTAPGVVLLNPSTTQTIAQPSGTNLLVNRFEGVRYADQFSGADGGAKIIAAIADLPSTGGIVDARNLSNPFINSTITISKPCTLYLPNGQIALNAGIVIASDGVSVIGTGVSPNLTPSTGCTDMVLNTGTVVGITVNTGAFGATVKNMQFIAGVARTAGSALQINGSGGTYDKIRIANTFNGIVIGVGGQGTFSECSVTTNGIAGTMNAGLLMGPTTAGNTINSSNFVSCQFFAGDFNSWTDALVVIDSGVDTPIFTDCQFVQSSVKATALNIRNTSTSNDPEWLMFNSCAFEGGQTFDGIKIDACRGAAFVGCTVNGKRGFNITGGRDIRIESNQIYHCANEGILVTGGTGITIIGNSFGDNSQTTNNTWDDIFINAATNGFDISCNRFLDVAGDAPANKPRYNINIGNASATNFNIIGNNMANSTAVTGFINNTSGTGAWNILANLPLSLLNDLRNSLLVSGNIQNFGATLSSAGLFIVYGGANTAGRGVPAIFGATSQRSESAADTNVVTFTPPAVAGSYRIRLTMAVSAQNTATLGWTATWKDANGSAQAPTNLSLFTSGTAAPALTVTAATNGNYYGSIDIDTDNSATAIVVKLTFTGTSFTAKVTSSIERIA